MGDINLLAVFVAGVVGFFFGGLWYSKKLLGEVWSRENGPHPKAAEGRHPAAVYGTGLGLSIIAAFAFAVWIGPDPVLATAVVQGLAVGACFVATSFGINYQFAGRSNTLWAIDAGYHIGQFAIFGVILGAF